MNQPVRKQTDSGIRRNSQVNDPPQDIISAGHISVIENGDELRRKQKKLKAQFIFYKKMNPSFTELAKDLMEGFETPWNASTFAEKTHLDESMYYKIVDNRNKGKIITNKVWSLRSVLAFCVGISANAQLAARVLASAGYVLTSSDEHLIYAFLFTDFEGCSIDECNYFLESFGIEPLGSRSRSTEDNW